MNKNEAREKVIADYLFNWTPSGHADESERNALRGIYDAGYAAALGERKPDVCELWMKCLECSWTGVEAERHGETLLVCPKCQGEIEDYKPAVPGDLVEAARAFTADSANWEELAAFANSTRTADSERVKVLTDMLRDSGIENIHTPVEPRYLGGKWLADAKGDEISMTYIASVLNGLAKAQQALAQAALEAGEKE